MPGPESITRQIELTLNKHSVTVGHRLINYPCAACGLPLKVGDHFTGYPVGPGIDPIQRSLCAHSEPYHPQFVFVHWACGTGLV